MSNVSLEYIDIKWFVLLLLRCMLVQIQIDQFHAIPIQDIRKFSLKLSKPSRRAYMLVEYWTFEKINCSEVMMASGVISVYPLYNDNHASYSVR